MRSASKNSSAPARKYARVFPMTKARNLDPFFSNSISLSARVKRMSVAFLHLASKSRLSFCNTVMWSPLSHSDLNRSSTEMCSSRFGKAEREIVTAATTPAHRSCSTVLMCSMTSGDLVVLGLMQRMYLVFVPFRVSINRDSWVLNFVHTVSATMFEVRLFMRVPEAFWAALGRFFFFVTPPPVAATEPAPPEARESLFNGFIMSSLLSSLAMMALLDSLAQFSRSLGRLSVFFLTKFVASYKTLPA
mmetsp:Transcript_82613/g.167429  ORF Transcript_82613/g.167429 Transcript_82613/m.167429 type:complete len:247 (+) Transcript_82613:1979-2719(+)